jgi:hypothetical protein
MTPVYLFPAARLITVALYRSGLRARLRAMVQQSFRQRAIAA